MSATGFLTLAILAPATLAVAQQASGIRPRDSSADYPAHQTFSNGTIAAVMVPPDQVKKLFATDLNGGGYIVVEVAIYPQASKEIDLVSGDFLLRVGSDPNIIRRVSAAAIAGSLQRKNTPKRRPIPGNGVSVYPAATIGYESGADSYGRRSRGVYTAATVGVAIGNDPAAYPAPPPGSTDRDRYDMEQELAYCAPPEGKFTQAVAGYLYFPKPAGKQKNAAPEITWYGADKVVHLTLPPRSN